MQKNEQRDKSIKKKAKKNNNNTDSVKQELATMKGIILRYLDV